MKKTDIISSALILSLAAAPAIASNDLVQLDLKRSSNDSVDVTLFTTDSYGDNVLVRKKSDNKYVILIPKVQSSGFKNSSLNGVKDLVSNIDVKTVNDTTGGYTKVTLITTKPLDIKTRTQKSAPQTAEQKEYNTLIAQANAIKNTAAAPKDFAPKQPQKTEVTVNKAPQNVQQPEKIKPTQKPKIELTEVNPEKLQKQQRKEHLTELINEIKNEEISQNVPENVPLVQSSEPVSEVKDITEMPKEQVVKAPSLLKNFAKKAKKALPYGAASLFALFILSKLLKSASRNVEDSIPAYSENEVAEENYPAVDNGLSWQEKYKLYLGDSAEPVKRADNKGNYTFIKNISDSAIEDKRKSLEQMVSDVQNSMQDEIEIVEVQSEDTAISKAIKFKAFDNRAASLKMTSRNKSRFKKYEVEIPLHEQKTIDLGDSLLHTNPRSLKDANLKVSDVDKNRIKYEPKDYIMSSIDEYLSIIDNEQKMGTTNPIDNNEFKKGLIVKSGFNIDKNKGFYLINKKGKNSLVGKVNDKVFVLKNFDSNISNPIQVRHDNANVYMVKAGGFKSLVEVNEDKMGVLIEL